MVKQTAICAANLFQCLLQLQFVDLRMDRVEGCFSYVELSSWIARCSSSRTWCTPWASVENHHALCISLLSARVSSGTCWSLVFSHHLQFRDQVDGVFSLPSSVNSIGCIVCQDLLSLWDLALVLPDFPHIQTNISLHGRKWKHWFLSSTTNIVVSYLNQYFIYNPYTNVKFGKRRIKVLRK